MTFSLTARCPRSGQLGVAVTSSSICVAARCAWARAGAGAVATQNVTDPRLGDLGLKLMEQGHGARAALAMLIDAGPYQEHRQLALVDDRGDVAHHTGAETLGAHAVAEGEACVAAGNLLADEGVPRAMVEAFGATPEASLAERLMRALEGGLAAGGEEGEVRSAGLLVVDRHVWPVADLRVDWHDGPIAELRRVWALYEPQMADYLTRALDPTQAPAYGVPGDP